MWLRQVTILNSDNAVFVGWTDHSTFIDLTVGVTSRRWMDKDFKRAENGHHAVGITHSHANLVDGFNIASKCERGWLCSAGCCSCNMGWQHVTG
jgi:hypothetical protein